MKVYIAQVLDTDRNSPVCLTVASTVSGKDAMCKLHDGFVDALEDYLDDVEHDWTLIEGYSHPDFKTFETVIEVDGPPVVGEG